VDKRSGDVTFADHSKSGEANFGEARLAFIAFLSVGDNSREQYMSTYRTHVRSAFGDMTLAQVAGDRDGVMDLAAVTMKDKAASAVVLGVALLAQFVGGEPLK
jgi:hypothetical protein